MARVEERGEGAPTDDASAAELVVATWPAVELDRPAAALPPDRNPVRVYLASLAEGSQRAVLSSLVLFASTLVGRRADVDAFPWWTLGYQHLDGVRARLVQRDYAPATVNHAITCVRQVLRHCRRLGLMTAEAEASARDVGAVRGTRLPPGRAATSEELAGMFRACEGPSPIAARDRALFALLVYAGLRRNELAWLRCEAYQPAQRVLRVRGKGNKEREIPVGRPLEAALARWLEVRGPGALRDPLLCPLSRTGTVFTTRRISAQTVYLVVDKLASAAGLVDHLAPHDLRRTFISELLDRIQDIAVAGQLAGHANTDTTRRYDRRGERAKRRAIDALDDLVPVGAPPAE